MGDPAAPLRNPAILGPGEGRVWHMGRIGAVF